MADRDNVSQSKTNTFLKGLNKDADPSFVQEGMWTHARNAVNNTREGDLGALSNEASNFLCATAGGTMQGFKFIIGAIHMYSDKWIIFTAAHGPSEFGDSINSEIGLFEDNQCKYRPIVQDPCLGLSKWHLITGASRETSDCSWQVYWSDGNNPDRYLNVGDPQLWPGRDFQWIGDNTYANPAGDTLQWPGVAWIQDCEEINNCTFCTNTTALDCDAIRLARLMETPCLHVSAGKAGGTLRNGSYFACIAYSIRGQKVTDYFSPSNVQPIWFDNDPAGALEIDVTADTENFDEFILVVVGNINQGAVAKQFGIYSTKTQKIYIDQIKEDLPSIPVEFLPIQTPVFEKSNQIIEVNNYLLRVGPTSKFDFNYQPLANLINAEWVSVEYPADYYLQGGYKPSYLRDEVYTFFIRWVYNTGDKSSAYHIPGRAPGRYILPCSGNELFETDPMNDSNTLFTPERVFEVYNTFSGVGANPNDPDNTLPDGGKIIGRGSMGYWESTEVYPADRPDIWNSSSYCWTGTSAIEHDLCGQPIRHHKFPDHGLNKPGLTSIVQHFRKDTSSNAMYIRLMGVEFSNITYPKDQDGNDIPGIVGYEILRGSREGNKSIIAKGMINNMRPYKIRGNSAGSRKGLYPNHPFNTITPSQIPGENTGVSDPYIIYDREDLGPLGIPPATPINPTIDDIPRNIITFHSPDTNFRTPFLSTVELKLYGHLSGISTQQFIEPDKHPQHKLLANLGIWMMIVGGIIEAIIASLGKRTINQPGAAYTRKFLTKTTGGAVNTITGPNGVFPPLPVGGGSIVTTPSTLNTEINFDEYEVTDNSDQNDFEDAAGVNAGNNGFINEFNAYLAGGAFDEALDNGETLAEIYDRFLKDGGLTKGGQYTAPYYNTELSGYQYFAGSGPEGTLGLPLEATKFLYYFSEGADITLRIIYALLPYRQYALQMIAHGPYEVFNPGMCSTIRRFKIEDSFYLNNNIQDMKPYLSGQSTQEYRINNLKRQSTVVIRTTDGAGNDTGPSFINSDDSLVTLGTELGTGGAPSQLGWGSESKTTEFNRNIASHYGGLKYRIVNQYGQLESIKLIPITPCEAKFNPVTLPTTGPVCGNPGVLQKKLPKSETLFNGDTYINRYTEKNSMFFFYDWQYGQPDGTEFNYYSRQLIPEPRFKMNSERYEVSDLNPFGPGFAPSISPVPTGSGILPNSFYTLDNEFYNYQTDEVPNQNGLGFAYPVTDGYPGLFGVKKSYFYLATSSVRDFFVESDVIVDFREPGVEDWERFYSPYYFTDLTSLFNINPDNITRGNYYSYDYSLSIGKLFTQYFSQGNLQSRYYNPTTAKLCYTYYPDRIIYSLPQQQEATKDAWFVYLANNYKEFKDKINGVKDYAKTGIFITFKNSGPLIFQGVDQLETEFGTKITIGDGGLFAQTPQSASVSDRAYQYGSSQNLRSVISTPAGFYYMSQDQGKILSFGSGLKELSQNGMKWWFNEFLPYRLTETFPDYPHMDNPVAGIGCQATYDNENTVVYFSKRDFRVREAFKNRLEYNTNTNEFLLDGLADIKLGDPTFFENASWTISYDPKNEFFISFHDWMPDLFIPTKNTFLTTKNNGMWKHNYICDNYCNYYGENKPFEVEFPLVTGQTVMTLRSVEYILECYKREPNDCIDQFQVLDFNFDRAVVYNPEQVSGYLNLNIFPKNNVTLSLEYPIINPNAIDILYTKEENKYRFNQFWDITADRGEFPVGSNYPPTGPLVPGTTVLQGPYNQRNIWVTEPNGFIKDLNPINLDYFKPELQRKRFRHYLNFVNLRKEVSGDVNMILKIFNSKDTYSPR
jgi:hypothetical protein